MKLLNVDLQYLECADDCMVYFVCVRVLGNTALHYAACSGHEDVVRALVQAGAQVEEHNENGHTPLMEAASAGFVGVAKIFLSAGAGINTHSNEFKESALTLACYKGMWRFSVHVTLNNCFLFVIIYLLHLYYYLHIP